ncbi:MAG: hypothetical protein HKN57_01445 [Xanthomonadales bacterium]|nr:hypothetical protein [Gammaproteobacteria bacterium]NND55894.1 hypothetical protein [Xanthomonadales bacterium]NNK50592.1 hypothetical protein [Xanthomonadales bacterium]
MRKAVNLLTLLVIVVVTVKLAMWAYQGLTGGEQQLNRQEVLEVDIVCMQVPDTGQCMCRHRDTNEAIGLSYEQCVARARVAQR